MLLRAQRLAFLFLVVLLAGHEAARISHSLEDIEVKRSLAVEGEVAAEEWGSRKASKTTDLDWDGCGKKGLLCNGEGCKRQYLWLDTPRQACRFTDEYKLTHRQEDFLKVELARLEEKSATFAKTGCLFGSGFSYDTYMWKCVRRTHQITRLARFIGKLVKAAQEDPSHPAHSYAGSAEVKGALDRIGKNVAAGFDKFEASKGTGLSYGKAYQDMLALPQKLAEAQAACARANCFVSEEEMRSQEEAYISASMLELVGANLTEDQRASLQAHIAADRRSQSTADREAQKEQLLDGFESDVSRTNLGGEIGDASLWTLSGEQKEAFHEELQTTGLANSTSLIDAGAGVAARGIGPLKWLVQYAPGWVVSRIAWLLLFVIGSALGIIRAGILFPLLLVACSLWKIVEWVFGDIIYQAGWEGEYMEVVKGFKAIGTCASWAWEFVGFETGMSATAVVGQIFVQPAKFSSLLTGVHHAWKSNSQLCQGVPCGKHAYCYAGKCFCQLGYYQAADSSDCEEMKSAHGCACRSMWTDSDYVVFSSTYYGCYEGRCAVDTRDPSYASCSESLRGFYPSSYRKSFAWDTCRDGPYEAQVPVKAIAN